MLILYEFDQNRHEQFLYDGLHLAMDNLKMQHPDYTIIPGRIKILKILIYHKDLEK